MQKLDWLGLFDKNNPIGVERPVACGHAAALAGAEMETGATG
jgi:hypothetical protein